MIEWVCYGLVLAGYVVLMYGLYQRVRELNEKDRE